MEIEYIVRQRELQEFKYDMLRMLFASSGALRDNCYVQYVRRMDIVMILCWWILVIGSILLPLSIYYGFG